METYDEDVADLTVSHNSVSTQAARPLVGRGLEMADAEVSQEQTFREQCFKYLEVKGYSPETDGDMIEFSTGGKDFEAGRRRYVIYFVGDPPSHFMIQNVDLHEKSVFGYADALILANDCNLNPVCVKTYIASPGANNEYTVVMFSSELYFSELFEYVFDHVLNAVKESARKFHMGVVSGRRG